ncbi:hypothetical protein P3S67_009861 [Capsicum chacoense]
MAVLLSNNPPMATSTDFFLSKKSTDFSLSKKTNSIGVHPPKNLSVARSIGFFHPLKNSSLTRLSIGFHPSKNSSLARSIRLHPSKNLNPSSVSSSLIACLSRPMETITASTEISRPIKQLPLLILAPKSTVNRLYSLWEKDVKEVSVESGDPPPHFYCHFFEQSVQGWLGYLSRKDCQLFLFNPLSGKKINLLSVEAIPSVECVIRNSQSGLVERIISDFSSEIPGLGRDTPDIPLISDVVLSSSPMDDDCVAVAIYGQTEKLCFCRKKRTRRDDDDHPNCWIPLHSTFMYYHQIVYHSGKKLFYTVSDAWRNLEAWDLHSDPIKRFHIKDKSRIMRDLFYWPPRSLNPLDWEGPLYTQKIHLAYDQKDQELFIVLRHCSRNTLNYTLGVPDIEDPYYKTVTSVPDIEDSDIIYHNTLSFDVFKVNFINNHSVKLQHLDDIGNRAFFVGINRSFVLSTTEFPELRSGSIYFADQEYLWEHNFGGHDMGIFDYKELDIIKLETNSPASSWFIPDVNTRDVDADF